ncbi:MAG: phage major capsid protein, partial [Planctomycetota bacterium]
NQGATEASQTVDQVKMSPKTASANTSYSRKLLLQSSIDVENFIRADLAAIIALGIDHAGLDGSTDADAPNGLNDTAGILTQAFGTAGQPTYAETINMWTKVATANALAGSLGYAMNPVQTGHLMTTPKFASGDTPIMATDSNLNGYRAPWSNQVLAGETWFGNWSDFIVGFWSGLDLIVDPFTNATTGAVRVVVHQDVDFAVRHAQSFCKGS